VDPLSVSAVATAERRLAHENVAVPVAVHGVVVALSEVPGTTVYVSATFALAPAALAASSAAAHPSNLPILLIAPGTVPPLGDGVNV
jgi:hypothetical protein